LSLTTHCNIHSHRPLTKTSKAHRRRLLRATKLSHGINSRFVCS